jgi:hypothetical protein
VESIVRPSPLGERALDRVLGVRAPLAVDIDAERPAAARSASVDAAPQVAADVAGVVAERFERLVALPRLDQRHLVADHALDVVGRVEQPVGRRLALPPHRVGGAGSSAS